MLDVDKIDVSEGIDAFKVLMHLKNVIFLSLLVFLDKGSQFQSSLCNRCRDILTMPININRIAIFIIHGVIINVLSIRLPKVKA